MCQELHQLAFFADFSGSLPFVNIKSVKNTPTPAPTEPPTFCLLVNLSPTLSKYPGGVAWLDPAKSL